MIKKYDYEKLIKRSILLAFRIDKTLDISVKPRKYGQPLAGMMLDIFRFDEYKKEQKLLCECRQVEIEANKAFKFLPSPSNVEFWYEVLTDWFTPLTEKEAFILRLWGRGLQMKVVALEYEKRYGHYPHRKSLYNWINIAVDKIKYHLWQKELSQKDTKRGKKTYRTISKS